MFYLGICYESGWGVPQNQCIAAELYRQASKEGHSTAQYNLAAFFEHGIGGECNTLHLKVAKVDSLTFATYK